MGDFIYEKGKGKNSLLPEGLEERPGVQSLSALLTPGSTILEIGMGLGKDIEFLSKNYRVSGSDISQPFIDIYRSKRPDADLLKLDAITLATDRKLDWIYSNKVLHLVAREQLKDSFCRQHALLNSGGIACHTLWYGDKKIKVKDQWMFYYTELTIRNYLNGYFEVLLVKPYAEMLEDDSLLLVLKKA